MKKVILGVVMALTSLMSFGQLQVLEKTPITEIGKLKIGPYLMASIEYSKFDEEQNQYTITLKNQRYQQINVYETLSFYGNDETIKDLHKLILSAFESNDIKSYEKTLQLGDELITIQGMKQLGVKSVYIHTSDSFIGLTENQWNKVFGI